MKNKSIWQDLDNNKDLNNKLEKDLDVDVLIIGGGITGLSTAYHLINKNLKICLVEKNNIGNGVTSKTTGKLTILQDDIYSKLEQYFDIQTSKLYKESQLEAISIVKSIINKHNIKCDFEQCKSYIFANDSKSKINKEINILNKLNIDLCTTSVLPNGTNVNKAFFCQNTYVFHPLKYLFKLKEICQKNNVEVYENTKIISITKKKESYVCKTSSNSIKSKYVVLACHYPFFIFPFLLPLKGYIEKSYIAAYKVPQNYSFSAISLDKNVISTRYHESNNIIYQLYLNNSHNAAFKSNDLDNFNSLLCNNNKPDFLWSNNDIITYDKLPFIGSLNSNGNLLIGTGYNTWGMTNGSIAGKILSDIILKNKNKYIKLFDPRRKLNILKIINFPVILYSNAFSFIKSKIKIKKKWYPESLRFEKRNGKNIAIYTDNEKKEHIVYPKCPHLKCNLIFNEIEKTWDCPCHASRFDIDGKSIEGPSNYNISYKNIN